MFEIAEDSNSEEVFQYYTIINDAINESNDGKEDGSNQVMYFTIDDVCDVGDSSTLETCDNNTQEGESFSSVASSSNVQIITLNDGRVFMTTTTEGENLKFML